MINHKVTKEDRHFMKQVECCEFPIDQFDHRAHLRLAYICLVQSNSIEKSIRRVKSLIIGLLRHVGINPSEKYHETLTQAWVRAVNYFMSHMKNGLSAHDFIGKNPIMLDSKIMLSHYSVDVLFSSKARATYIEPNLAPIPNS